MTAAVGLHAPYDEPIVACFEVHVGDLCGVLGLDEVRIEPFEAILQSGVGRMNEVVARDAERDRRNGAAEASSGGSRAAKRRATGANRPDGQAGCRPTNL